eukprot:scaffold650021_cov42-Prasinocladus_malaysianus.AAC.1
MMTSAHEAARSASSTHAGKGKTAALMRRNTPSSWNLPKIISTPRHTPAAIGGSARHGSSSQTSASSAL